MKNFVSAVKYIKTIKKLYDSSRIAAYSAQGAYFVLLSLVPLILLVTIILGTAPFVKIDIQPFLYRVLSQQAAEGILRLMAEFKARPPVPFLSVTMVFVVWAATRGVRSIADGVHNIFGCGKGYGVVQRALRSVVYTFVVIAVCLLSLASLLFVPSLRIFTQIPAGTAGAAAISVLYGTVFFATLTLLFATAYNGLAKSGIPLKNQLPGAAVASAGWMVYSFGYSVYIKYFSRYSVLYGSFGAVMLFMLWLYMCMNILLCGALINRLLYKAKCD